MPQSVVLLAPLLMALALGMFAWAVSAVANPQRVRSVNNLNRGHDVTLLDPLSGSGRGGDIARRLTPAPLLRALERQHARAGRPASWSVPKLLGLKLAWVPVAAVLLGMLVTSGQAPILVLTGTAAMVLVYFLPDLLLLSRGQERDQKIQVELADTLDQMTIAVEAGLGFDAAMSRAAANGKGALAEEITRTLQDIRMGMGRRQAFEDLAARNQVADLRQFVRAILQADAFGISVGDVLRTQAGEMRMKRRQRAEEAAQKVPVKVIFPLLVCILPVLFIVVMGPAAMSMVAMFSGAQQ